ncbi:uncharacterized protein I303_104326 [Kwoniella dejecticola CBS 10117]|uniref:Uncharacterized protein n=1 Tax=Kwoniella dejecticola CBS 10117 TaxID=1296121 RepID=A0A1A6A5M9_9TREE|nr:uncharacterized protein I303_04700 [Kwoniella dejecticola CBS 10117]OBR85365.1 hypothetical protein I303_04700 [Kwoniella dejecticola CBS 10117]
MSTPTPEASGVRQRANKVQEEETKNPASLSSNPNKKVPRNKPNVKPPFIDMSMNKFLTYLVLSLGLVLAFYIWRFVTWAHQVGGYWAVITGNHKSPVSDAAASAASAASSISKYSESSPTAVDPKSIVPKPTQPGQPEDDIQSQIYHLANALGIKPAELSAAIRPLVDPSVPDPAAKAQHEADLLRAQVEAKAAEHKAEATDAEGGVLGILGEALLD